MALCRLNSPSNLKLSSAKDRAGRGLGTARRRWDGHSCSAHTHLPSWGSLLPGPFCLDMTYAALFSQHFSGNCFAAGSPCCYSKAQGWEASSAPCYQEESCAAPSNNCAGSQSLRCWSISSLVWEATPCLPCVSAPSAPVREAGFAQGQQRPRSTLPGGC